MALSQLDGRPYDPRNAWFYGTLLLLAPMGASLALACSPELSENLSIPKP